MQSRFRAWSVVVLMAVAALLLRQLPVHGQSHDLDSYDDRRLDRDLEAELDDIYEDFAPDRQVPLETLEQAILEALSDDGDEGDEDDIDEADLEAEVEEAGDTLDGCVERGLAQADRLAGLRRPGEAAIVRVSLLAQRTDMMTTPRLAVRQVKAALIFDVRKAQGRRE